MRIPIICAVVALVLGGLAGCGSNDNSETPRPGEGTAEQNAQDSGAEGRAPAGARAEPCAPVPLLGAADIRATRIDCAPARLLAVAVADSGACAGKGSRSACTVRGFRCLVVKAGSGRAVSCARPGRSVSFVLPAA